MIGLLADPVFYIGAFLSVAAAVAFLIFIAGFLPGAPHLINLSGNADHLAHYRARAMWGFMLLLFLFIVWEVIRFLAELF